MDGPIKFVDKKILGKSQMQINGSQTSQLIGYRINIWNSGYSDIKKMPVKIRFSKKNNNFRILSRNIETKPIKKVDFGKIEHLKINKNSEKYTFELMKKRDEATFLYLLNSPAKFNVSIRKNNLDVNYVNNNNLFSHFIYILSAIIALIATLIFQIITLISKKAVLVYNDYKALPPPRR